MIEIRVDGQGYDDWLAKQKNRKNPKDKSGSIDLTDCSPQTANCDADEGGEGVIGNTGVDGEPYINPTAGRGAEGKCTLAMNPNGGPTVPGDDGLVGKKGGMGKKGRTGGIGGTIMFTITDMNSNYVFSSKGGKGGKGGQGGTGGRGGFGGDGGIGGKGADCPCELGGSGSGADGLDGGQGGQG